MQREAEQLAAARAAAIAGADAREAAWVSQPQQVVIDTQRPWAAVSSTYYMSPELEAEARRRGQREASEANRATAQRRAAAQAVQGAAEQQALRQTMVAEVRWAVGGISAVRCCAEDAVQSVCLAKAGRKVWVGAFCKP